MRKEPEPGAQKGRGVVTRPTDDDHLDLGVAFGS
jgi:hypothetical protein